MPPKKHVNKKEPAVKRKLDLNPKTPPSKQSSARASTPAANSVDLTESPAKKRNFDSFFGKAKPQAALVTPPKKQQAAAVHRHVAEASPSKKQKVGTSSEQEYIPKYIHKNVEYKRKGQTKDSTLVATYELVEKYYEIPDDFENNRKYGPLSGVSYEERAIAAYAVDLLSPKTDKAVAICSACATEGHKRSACPKLI